MTAERKLKIFKALATAMLLPGGIIFAAVLALAWAAAVYINSFRMLRRCLCESVARKREEKVTAAAPVRRVQPPPIPVAAPPDFKHAKRENAWKQ